MSEQVADAGGGGGGGGGGRGIRPFWGIQDILYMYEDENLSPSVFCCTSTPMATGPIVTCVETYISPDLNE